MYEEYCEYCDKAIYHEYYLDHLVDCINKHIEDTIERIEIFCELDWYFLFDDTEFPPPNPLSTTTNMIINCLKIKTVDVLRNGERKELAIKFCAKIRQALMEEIRRLRRRHESPNSYLAGLMGFFNILIKNDCESIIPEEIKFVKMVVSANADLVEDIRHRLSGEIGYDSDKLFL